MSNSWRWGKPIIYNVTMIISYIYRHMHGYCNPAANKDLKYTMKKTQTMYVYVYTHPVKAYDVHMLK